MYAGNLPPSDNIVAYAVSLCGKVLTPSEGQVVSPAESQCLWSIKIINSLSRIFHARMLYNRISRPVYGLESARKVL